MGVSGGVAEPGEARPSPGGFGTGREETEKTRRGQGSAGSGRGLGGRGGANAGTGERGMARVKALVGGAELGAPSQGWTRPPRTVWAEPDTWDRSSGGQSPGRCGGISAPDWWGWMGPRFLLQS